MKSEKKAAAARENGKKGGRPRINYNGHTWDGSNNPLSKLFEMLNSYQLRKDCNFIERLNVKERRYWGNFETYSHAFSVDAVIGSEEEKELQKLFRANRRKHWLAAHRAA